MKRGIELIMAAALLLALPACSGSGNIDEILGIEGPFTLSVDKSEIEADGKEVATLVLTDANGNVLTDTDQLKYIAFENLTTGVKTHRANQFTFIQNGEFTFRATYKANTSTNTVTVKARNRGAYEKYFRKVALHELTDVKCGFCPQMASALENIPEISAKQMVILAVHGGFSQVDPWNIGIGSSMLSAFGGGGWPYVIFDLNDTYSLSGTVNNSTEMSKIIEKQLRDYPATCGIKVSSELTSEGDVKIIASLKSDKGGSYDLAYAVVKDNCTYVGGTSPTDRYNDVVVGLTSNYMTYSQQNGFTVNADGEHSEEWLFDASEGHLCIGLTEDDKAECRVVVYALRSLNGKAFIDNVVECPLGSCVDYKLND